MHYLFFECAEGNLQYAPASSASPRRLSLEQALSVLGVAKALQLPRGDIITLAHPGAVSSLLSAATPAPWLSYAATLSFHPLFPKSALDDAFPRSLKDSRIGLLKDLALAIKEPAIALLFWEHFFQLLFDPQAHPALGKSP